MSTFTPPVTYRCPTDYVGGNDRYFPVPQPLRTLYGRYLGELKAMNVYKLVAGGYVDDGPTGGGQPYDNPPGTVIAYTYLGSHTYDVTTAEAAALTAAGYGAGVTP